MEENKERKAQLEASYKRFRNLRNFFIIFGSIVGGASSILLFSILFYWLIGVGTKLTTNDMISYGNAALMGISMLVVGIVVFGNLAKQRLQQIKELESKKK